MAVCISGLTDVGTGTQRPGTIFGPALPLIRPMISCSACPSGKGSALVMKRGGSVIAERRRYGLGEP